MSTNFVNKSDGTLTVLGGSTRVWCGTKSAHDNAVQQGTMPNNCMVCITDDAPGEEAWQYSTNETRTGKTWIDGKPIYRLCEPVSGPVASDTYRNIGAYAPTNLDTLIRRDMTANFNSNHNIYFNSSWQCASETSGTIPVGAYLIIEYTKTTD